MKNIKKEAMFGLDFPALKKHFGELFLLRRQSEDSIGANGSSRYTKRAAMFGLDARIALAIFGALSVISGAALYSAIKEAKAVATIAELNELAKAREQYYLDTRVKLSSITELAENNKNLNGWNGPYVSYDTGRYYDANYDLILHRNGMAPMTYWNIMFSTADFDTWSGGLLTPCTSSSTRCAKFIVIIGVDDASLINAIDNKVDNGDGLVNGKVRTHTVSFASYPSFAYYLAPASIPE